MFLEGGRVGSETSESRALDRGELEWEIDSGPGDRRRFPEIGGIGNGPERLVQGRSDGRVVREAVEQVDCPDRSTACRRPDEPSCGATRVPSKLFYVGFPDGFRSENIQPPKTV